MTESETQIPESPGFGLRNARGRLVSGVRRDLDLSGNYRLLLYISVSWVKRDDDDDITKTGFQPQ